MSNKRSIRIIPALAPVILAALISSCGSGSAGASPDGVSPGGGSNNSSSDGGSSNVVGESCTGDSNKVCLAVHFVSYKDSSGNVAASTAEAANIIHTMNTIWSQCSIGFQIEKYDAVDPTQYGLSYGSNSQNQLNQIRQTFKSPTNELLGVTTGPWGTSVNAWTNMPGEGVYGAIMEASIVNYGGGIIYAHEFGHYLGLDHVSNTANLMNPVIYTTSNALTSSQCQAARQTAQSYWSAMLR